MINLKDKVVIITGASSGIGKATSLEFAQKGAAVVLAARRLDKLQALHDDIVSFNDQCLVVQTDVTSEDQVAQLFNAALNRFGRIDIVVNNAGRGLKREIVDMSLQEWHDVVETNLTSVFLCSKEALKRMTPQKMGHIITICSVAGLYGLPHFNYAAYTAAKHGVTGFQRSLTWEARQLGINVSTIFPGRVDTEFFSNYPTRPPQGQMLSARDLADYIVTVAEQRPFKRSLMRILNMGKRIRNVLR